MNGEGIHRSTQRVEQIDSDVIDRFTRQDPEAFTAIYTAYKPLVDRHLSRHFQGTSEELRQDISQVAFLNAWRGAQNYRQEKLLSTWLIAIARNAMKSHFRSQHIRPEVLVEPEIMGKIADHHIRPGEPASRKIELHETLDALPEILRSSVFLVVIHGYSVNEAADKLGVPVGTIKSRLFTARTRLRRDQELYELLSGQTLNA